MWSSVNIPGKPSVLVVDATRNLEGWEHEFTNRLSSSLRRSGLALLTETPLRIAETRELKPHLSSAFNCMLFFSHGQGQKVSPSARMKTHWDWLNTDGQLPVMFFAALMCESYDPEASREILESNPTFAPLAVSPQSPVMPREAGLFLLKFFTELNLHSPESLSGKMVWFSFSKARELLRKRRYTGKFGIRC
jgi:hypothetical protein